MRKLTIGAAAAASLIVATLGLGAAPAGASPTCVDFFEDEWGLTIANHGQHIIGGYIMGTGNEGDWPFAGEVGDVVGGRGPAVAGAPGIHQHGAAPGASFCVETSNSPGWPHEQ